MKTLAIGNPTKISFQQNFDRNVKSETSNDITQIKESQVRPVLNGSSYGVIIHDYTPKNYIDIKQIKDLDVLNLRSLSARTISGGTFARRPIADLQKLKKAGVESVVDFRSEATGVLKEKCDKANLRYFQFPLDGIENFSNDNYFTKSKTGELVVKDEFVKSLRQYFDIINDSKTYIGCHYGVDRTNIGVLLNYLLNSQNTDLAPEIKSWPGVRLKSVINKDIKTIKKIFKRLTQDQKALLNLSEDSKEAIACKIVNVLKRNIYK